MKARSVLKAAGVAALVTASVVVAAQPAQASLSQCLSNRACGWTDSNYSAPSGGFAVWTATSNSFGNLGLNNQLSSVANNRYSNVVYYTGQNRTGNPWTVAPGGGGYFSPVNWQNDNFESILVS